MPPDVFLTGLLTLLGVGGTVLLAYSPIARAIGDRIRYGPMQPGDQPGDDGRVDEMAGEMAAMRQALSETQERLEFAERMLANAKAQGALPGER